MKQTPALAWARRLGEAQWVCHSERVVVWNAKNAKGREDRKEGVVDERAALARLEARSYRSGAGLGGKLRPVVTACLRVHERH